MNEVNLNSSKQVRCIKCCKLLGIDYFSLYFLVSKLDVKCPRCGCIQTLLNDNVDRQIIITDKKGVILFINQAVEKETGYSLIEAVNKTPALWGGTMSRQFYQRMWESIALKKKAIALKMINKKKDGTLYNVFLRISPILDETGEVQYFLGIETKI